MKLFSSVIFYVPITKKKKKPSCFLSQVTQTCPRLLCFPVPEQALPGVMWPAGDWQKALFGAGQNLSFCFIPIFSSP